MTLSDNDFSLSFFFLGLHFLFLKLFSLPVIFRLHSRAATIRSLLRDHCRIFFFFFHS